MATVKIHINTSATVGGDGTKESPFRSFAEAGELISQPLEQKTTLMFHSSSMEEGETAYHWKNGDDLRCRKCNKLLATPLAGFVGVEIKCSRCKTLNKFEALEALASDGQGNGNDNSIR